MSNADWSYELERLELVLAEIKAQLATREGVSQASQDKVKEMLAEYWQDKRTGDEAQYMAALNNQKKLQTLSYKELRKMLRMAKNPYFGRLDFVEDDTKQDYAQPEKIYLGIGSLISQDSGEVLVSDWRAPVSSLFYDYERGKAVYQTPAGEISGEITLKRQYKIQDGKLEYMFDCDLKIDDEVLQQLLSKNADEKMRTIVTSIQREQNRIIRDEKHKLLAVQGTAGSGKTSIALHRIAYLLYKEKERLTSENVVILSPNRIFSDYISEVLPELGEESVLHWTFPDLVQKYRFGLPNGYKIEEWAEQMEYLITAPEDDIYAAITAGISFKSNPGFINFLDKYIKHIEESAFNNFPKIAHGNDIVFSRDELKSLWQDLKHLPLSQRLFRIKKRILAKLGVLTKEIREQKLTQIISSKREVNERTMKAMARLETWKELKPLRLKIDEHTKLDTFALYRQAYENKESAFIKSAAARLPENWVEICRETIFAFDQKIIPYEDLCPLLYVKGLLHGFPADTNIQLLVVDEAQDYTALHYELLKQLFPRATWTVLGDLNQMVHPHLNTISFREIANVFGNDQAELMELTKSYRSTIDIMEFANTLLADKTEIEYVQRSGAKPAIIKAGTADSYFASVIERIAALQKEGYQSIAIICKNIEDGKSVYEGIKGKVNARLITNDEVAFQRGIMIIPVYFAKGLEFDAVIVHDVSDDKYHREWERKLLYVACTRAMHQLNLLYTGELSGLLPSIYSNLFSHTEI